MKGKSESPEFIQGNFFEGWTFSIDNSPDIAFSALKQIQSLRAKNKLNEATAMLEEWVL
tara:strand:- start:301 stop:477 length:177 start_codon:yes stop_codon:yes gene_type:complete